MTTNNTPLYKEIELVITSLNTDTISEDRKIILQQLTDAIQKKLKKNQLVTINFICTHNSRRSHLSQIWAQTLANYYNINKVFCYSAGTEATAIYPAVLTVLKQSGFKIEILSKQTPNPIYTISTSNYHHPIIGFSKTLDSSFNPKDNTIAVLTCTSADKNCPIIFGADTRIALPFKDPKAFDNTSQQLEKYKERSLQIATELKYVFSKLKLY